MKIQAVYASTSGNVEAVVEAVAAILTQAGHQVELHRAEKTSPEIFSQNDVFLLATSTWEHGVLNPFFQPLHKEMSKLNLAGKQAVMLGLGDTRYEPVLFCEGIEILRQTWLKQNGTQLGQTLKINGEPYHLLETTVAAWAKQVVEWLETAHVA
jgi:flavodoxin